MKKIRAPDRKKNRGGDRLRARAVDLFTRDPHEYPGAGHPVTQEGGILEVEILTGPALPRVYLGEDRPAIPMSHRAGIVIIIEEGKVFDLLDINLNIFTSGA